MLELIRDDAELVSAACADQQLQETEQSFADIEKNEPGARLHDNERLNKFLTTAGPVCGVSARSHSQAGRRVLQIDYSASHLSSELKWLGV